jgi:hypothetical protein
MVVANLQTAPITGFGLAFYCHFLADGGVATRAIVDEADAYDVISIASELVTERVACIG